MKQALIILGRYPKMGSAKTRLAEQISQEKAIKFYKACAEHIFSEADKIANQVNIHFLYADPEDEQLVQDWVGDKYKILPPTSDEINQNILNGFENLFKKDFEKIVVVASDVPDLNSEIILKAFKILGSHDIVIGPDNDGGIYLYGQLKNYPEIFNILDGQIFKSVLDSIKKKNLKYYVLKKLIDIDTKQDLLNWFKQNKNHPLVKTLDFKIESL